MRKTLNLLLVGIVPLFGSLLLQAQSGSQAAPEPLAGGNVAAGTESTMGTAVPRLLQFAGVLMDSTGKPATGSVSVTFSLYEFQDGGSPLWSETQTLTLDSQGRYTAFLGAASPDSLPLDLFTTGLARWLGIAPQLPGAGELPRILLVGVPYALKAADADTLGGKPASAFVTVDSQSSSANGESVTQTASGNHSLAVLPLQSQSAPLFSCSGCAANFVPLLTDASGDLTDSIIFQSTSGNVGVGTTNPSQQLTIWGGGGVGITGESGIQLLLMGNQNSLGANDPSIIGAANGQLYFGTGTSWSGTGGTFTSNLYLSQTGNVEIGGQNPQAKLQVDGALRLNGSGSELVFPDGTVQTTAGGDGTITGVTAGSGLSGGGTSGPVSLTNTGILAVGVGQGLTTTGGQTPILSLNTGFTNGVYAQLASSNTFSGTQTVSGNIVITGSGNGLTFPDGTSQTTAGMNSLTNVAANYTGTINLTCPSGDIVVVASCSTGGYFVGGTLITTGAAIVLNDQTTTLPAGATSWANYLTPSASNATGVHCNSGSGVSSLAQLRCARP